MARTRTQHSARTKRTRETGRAYRKWTKKEDAQLASQVAAGMPAEDIAAAHKRTIKGIETRASKLGVGPLNHSRGAARSTVTRQPAPTPKKGFFRRFFG